MIPLDHLASQDQDVGDWIGAGSCEGASGRMVSEGCIVARYQGTVYWGNMGAGFHRYRGCAIEAPLFMGIVILKLLVAPSLVALATLVARRFGPAMGGWVVGFPIVAGPILLFFSIEQGPAFAAQAACSTLLGTVSLASFGLVYAWVAVRGRWVLSLLAGWTAFALLTWLQSGRSVPAIVGLVAALLALRGVLALLPRLEFAQATPVPGAWDIPVRMLATAALVLGLTWAASSLGPALSGLLTPFPVASTVLVVFAHKANGPAAAVRVLRGLLLGLQSFSVFCFVLSLTLTSAPAGITGAFVLALALSFPVQLLVLRFARRGA